MYILSLLVVVGLVIAMVVDRYDPRPVLTAVFKKVVGTHFFFALFGRIGAHSSPPPPRQPHGIKVSHIAKLNHAVI